LYKINRIRGKLKNSFIFSAVEQKELEIIVDAMEQKQCKENEVVIKQGDEGDCLYVVEAGLLTCTKQFVFRFVLLFK